MKKIILLLLAILLQSCWICPDRHNLEFDYDTKIIKVLSEGYFVESIKITEYIQKEKYVEYIDSNYVEIKQNGTLLNQSIDLRELNKNYIAKGINLKEMLSKKEIAFEIMVKNPKLKTEDENARAFIYFITDSLTKGKLIAESNGCK